MLSGQYYQQRLLAYRILMLTGFVLILIVISRPLLLYQRLPNLLYPAAYVFLCLIAVNYKRHVDHKCIEWFHSLTQQKRNAICPECGYDLTGLPDKHACPECGREYTFEEIKAVWQAFIEKTEQK